MDTWLKKLFLKLQVALETTVKGLKIVDARNVQNVLVICYKLRNSPENAIYLVGHEFKNKSLFDILKIIIEKIALNESTQNQETVH